MTYHKLNASCLAVQQKYDWTIQKYSVRANHVLPKQSRNFSEPEKPIEQHVTLTKHWLLCTLVMVLGIAVILAIALASFSLVKQKRHVDLLLGQLPSTPARSCADIFQVTRFSPSGYYWICSPNSSINRQCIVILTAIYMGQKVG